MNFRLMSRTALLAGAAGLIILLCHHHFSGSVSAAKAPGDPATPVLVELFTSEGCSDCPPADALLANLQKTQPISGAKIIILEEHVTYWDQLGWKDPYSFRLMTTRQADYADAFGGQQVYTPQMIVDGQAAFVGSSAAKATRAIQFAAVSSKTPVDLQWTTDGKLKIEVPAIAEIGEKNKADVYLAITEDTLHSNVNRGENSGRALDHDGVVRQLDRVGEIDGASNKFSSSVALRPAKEWNRANLHAVLFVQDQKRLRVLAAAQVPFPAS